MSPIERVVLWIVAVVGLFLGGYNCFAGRELTEWARSELQPWTAHTDNEIAHSSGPPADHDAPPPPPPW
jgi:hypothetical protein